MYILSAITYFSEEFFELLINIKMFFPQSGAQRARSAIASVPTAHLKLFEACNLYCSTMVGYFSKRSRTSKVCYQNYLCSSAYPLKMHSYYTVVCLIFDLEIGSHDAPRLWAGPTLSSFHSLQTRRRRLPWWVWFYATKGFSLIVRVNYSRRYVYQAFWWMSLTSCPRTSILRSISRGMVGG